MKRGLTIVVIAVVGVLAWAGTAGAQVHTTVTVSGTTAMGVAQQCFTEPTTSPGSVTFSRTSTEGALTISYHISGGPTDLNSDPTAGANRTVDFPDGAATVTVVVHPAIDAVDAVVTILTPIDNGHYVVGDPASGTIVVNRTTTTCPTTSVAPSSTLARTGVRSTTAPLALTGMLSIVLGSLLLVLSSRRKAPGLR